MTNAYPCPQCGQHTVVWDYTCHTWPQRNGDTDRWMSCLPCDSATEFTCMSDDCTWSYTWGLNPGNPRAAENEADKPAWLDGHTSVPDGIPDMWDWDDE